MTKGADQVVAKMVPKMINLAMLNLLGSVVGSYSVL